MEDQTIRYSNVERWLLHLRWGPCLLGVVIGCVCTSVLGLSIGLIAHPYLTSMINSSDECSNEVQWGPCSDLCNKDTQTGIKQIRQVIDGKCVTVSNTSVQQPRRTERNCPADGGWSRWEQFGSCSSTCGQGVIPIVRRCDSPVPMNNGKYCDGQSYYFGTCFVEPCAEENLALKKQTRQSSWMGEMHSHFGVDGVICTKSADKCIHTEKDFRAWWAVDLGGEFDIKEVVLYGRTDCCTERLSNFDIDVFRSRTSTKLKFSNFNGGIMSRCHYQPGIIVNNVLKANCAQGTTGQFVRVQLRGFNFLTLCEVKVYGTETPQSLIDGINLIYGESYLAPGVRVIKDITEDKCFSLCRIETNRGCLTSFIHRNSTCIVVGSSN